MTINVAGIDPETEELVSLREAVHLFPKKRGRAPNIASIYRHAQHGSRGIKLETVQLPCGKFTSRQAVARFIRRLSGLPIITTNSASYRRRQDVAVAALDRAGI